MTAVLLLALGANAGTNWLTESTAGVVADTNGVVVWPAHDAFMGSNDLASATNVLRIDAEVTTNLYAFGIFTNLNDVRLTNDEAILATATNDIAGIQTNIQALAGASNYVNDTGDAMVGDLYIKGSNVFTNVYSTTFSADPTADGWSTTGWTWMGSAYMYAIAPILSTYRFTYTNSLQPTNVYRITWTQQTLTETGQYGYTSYDVLWSDNADTGLAKYAEIWNNNGTASNMAALFTGQWDRIIFSSRGYSAPATFSVCIDDVAIARQGANLALHADSANINTANCGRVIGDGSGLTNGPWWRYGATAPTGSTSAAQNYTIAASAGTIYVCLTNGWFGPGTNWASIAGSVFP